MRNKVFDRTLLVLIAATSLWAVAGQKEEASAKRETILDRSVHLEKTLIMEIPQFGRLCDELKLEKKRINVGDCELYVEEEGRGIPVVLLHGGPGATHHYFHPYFAQAGKFARIIYYDQRGCGISDYKPGDGYSVNQAVEDLESLRQALHIEKWVVLGHSYGGYLAQRYAMAHPRSVSGLIVLTGEPGLPGKYSGTRQYDFISAEERQRMQEIRKELGQLLKDKKVNQEQWLEILVYNNHLNGDWKRQSYFRPSEKELARMARFEWKQDTNFNSLMSRDIRKVNLDGAFAECPIPTLIMESKMDLTWPPEKAQVLQANHPGSRLIMFEHSGHSPFADEPDRFFSELKAFVTSLRPVTNGEASAWKESLAQWRKDHEDKFLTVPMGEDEAKSIEEFRHIREGIREGKRYEDTSTPLRTFLSFISAVHFRDKESLDRLQPPYEFPEQTLAQLDQHWMTQTDILRAPLPPKNPAELEVWPVYLKTAAATGSDEPIDTNLFIYWRQRWLRAGNQGGGDWRPFGPLIKKSFLEKMTKK
jgi:proline iminopeptidase